MNKENEKLEEEIQKQKLKVSDEMLKLKRMEYEALSLGMYDSVKELFIKRSHASLLCGYADNDFEMALLKERCKRK